MRTISAGLALGAIALLSNRVEAGVPNALMSSVPACVLACPQGDIPDTVVSRDIAGNPQPGEVVVVDFSQCSGVSLCAGQLSAGYTILSPTRVQITTDRSGRAVFALQATGRCSGGVDIFLHGIWLTDPIYRAKPPLINVDQDGDGVVTSADQQILAARAANDPLGDLNCDGTHNAIDMAVLTAHLGHQCSSSAVPARSATWGAVKIRYH